MIWPAVHRRHAIPAVILAALGACGGREPGHPLAVRRDSAGIQIVENRDPAWPSGQGWRIADTPFVQVGAQEGDPQYQFSEVRGVLRLDDGRLVVGDGESRQLRFYSADGVFDLASGRQGGGPGEFGRLGWVGRYRGDSIATYDWEHRRLSVFDAHGVFARSATLQAMGDGFPIVMQVFADGELLVRTGGFIRPGQQGGVRRDTVLLARYDAAGTGIDSIAPVPGFEAFVLSEENSITSMSLPFGHGLGAAVRDTMLYLGTADTWELTLVDRTGRLHRIVRRDLPPRPVGSADVDAWRNQQRSDELTLDAGFRARLQRMRDAVPIPSVMPAYGELMADSDGNLWVQDYRSPADTLATMTVFDSTGQLLGTLRLPEGFRVYQIGREFVAGVWRDEDEVEFVRIYELKR